MSSEQRKTLRPKERLKLYYDPIESLSQTEVVKFMMDHASQECAEKGKKIKRLKKCLKEFLEKGVYQGYVRIEDLCEEAESLLKEH